MTKMTKAEEKEIKMNKQEVETVEQKMEYIRKHSFEITKRLNSDDNIFYMHFVEYLVDDKANETVLSLSNRKYNNKGTSPATIIFTTIEKIDNLGFDEQTSMYLLDKIRFFTNFLDDEISDEKTNKQKKLG